MSKNLHVSFLLTCFLTLTLSACKQPEKKKFSKAKAATVAPPESSKQEDQAVERVLDLPEMKQAARQIEQSSQGKNHLTAYVETPPTVAEPYYWVKVGEDNGGSIVTEYMFTVDQKSGAIKYDDLSKDTLITLQEWRKSKVSE